jgi:hypothetical protein
VGAGSAFAAHCTRSSIRGTSRSNQYSVRKLIASHGKNSSDLSSNLSRALNTKLAFLCELVNRTVDSGFLKPFLKPRARWPIQTLCSRPRHPDLHMNAFRISRSRRTSRRSYAVCTPTLPGKQPTFDPFINYAYTGESGGVSFDARRKDIDAHHWMKTSKQGRGLQCWIVTALLSVIVSLFTQCTAGVFYSTKLGILLYRAAD